MKKQNKTCFIIALALILTMALTACSGNTAGSGAQTADTADTASTDAAEAETAEEEWEPIPEDLYAGLWYAMIEGVPMTLELRRDGAYTMTMGVVSLQEDGTVSAAAASEDALEGTWTLEDGLIYLDGEEEASFEMRNSMLYWFATGDFFTAEAPQLYQPADLRKDAKTGDFDGYWVSAFAGIDGLVLNADVIDDNTDIYIEGENVALGGDIFGDDTAKFTLADGLMSYTDGTGNEKITVTLGLQEDGYLRLVFIGGDNKPLTLYLSRIPSEEELEQWQRELEEMEQQEAEEEQDNPDNTGDGEDADNAGTDTTADD